MKTKLPAMTYALVTVVANERAARALRSVVMNATEIPKEAFDIRPSLEGRSALWIDHPAVIAKAKVEMAAAIGKGFYAGYERGWVDEAVVAGMETETV